MNNPPGDLPVKIRRPLGRTVSPRLAAIVLCMCAVGALHAKDDPGKGLRFSSPQVLDLAERAGAVEGPAIPVVALGAADAAKIVAAPTLSEDAPSLVFSDDLYGCKPPSTACSQQHERKLIDSVGGSVNRDGKRLGVVPAQGAPLAFVDWKVPATKSADGDEETHWYLGRLAGSGYHRVEVQFGQDSPGSFLVNPASGTTAFVHNGSDVAVPSPDGMHLATFNTLNPPLSMRVAALDASGPRLALQCDVGKDADRVVGAFRGWHDAHSFDIALQVHAETNKLQHAVALRVVQDSTGWRIATPDPAQLTAIGFACRQPAGQRGMR